LYPGRSASTDAGVNRGGEEKKGMKKEENGKGRGDGERKNETERSMKGHLPPSTKGG